MSEDLHMVCTDAGDCPHVSCYHKTHGYARSIGCSMLCGRYGSGDARCCEVSVVNAAKKATDLEHYLDEHWREYTEGWMAQDSDHAVSASEFMDLLNQQLCDSKSGAEAWLHGFRTRTLLIQRGTGEHMREHFRNLG